ncbi:hypothetical protein [Chryseolinea lacunae]|uniref:Uncharacterized protein n=1 Tax=Chryseolinea lacunae TaxID=2801331 RepID=A0ABS1KXA2_9BACT|nr:hypothetical protein [Chryseolinea lacunae]MBL0743833.1 hypothetical protein [Chryseolinea lacunae]
MTHLLTSDFALFFGALPEKDVGIDVNHGTTNLLTATVHKKLSFSPKNLTTLDIKDATMHLLYPTSDLLDATTHLLYPITHL